MRLALRNEIFYKYSHYSFENILNRNRLLLQRNDLWPLITGKLIIKALLS